MIEFIFMLSFGLSVISIMLASLSNWKWYWVAGLCVYIFSCISIWDFRGYTLSVTFVLWALAIGHTLKLINKLYHSVIVVIIGLILWFFMFNTFDFTLWFPPFRIFS
ncbi:membrane hypothetical protein [Candidatus Desulfosporosinus infrequens]|uniref:Uncharacterized protein n=1 Tax=Candidatus Desulfosporosinus infrequens TaxID=2043169 RepID=A0A2U3LKM4_9FIRM|nr:membrane hypothetical protein [Candidatus Desulfosporosinus infrequens]